MSKNPREEHEKLRNAFFKAAMQGHTADIESFLKQGLRVNEPDNNGATALLFAVSAANRETTAALIADGADINAALPHGFISVWDVFPEGTTPLLLACMRNAKDIATLLVNTGANLKATDSYGLTALHYAAKRGNTEMVEMLLAHGADIHARDKAGHTAEYFARENGYKKLADELKKRMGGGGPKAPKFHL